MKRYTFCSTGLVCRRAALSSTPHSILNLPERTQLSHLTYRWSPRNTSWGTVLGLHSTAPPKSEEELDFRRRGITLAICYGYYISSCVISNLCLLPFIRLPYPNKSSILHVRCLIVEDAVTEAPMA
jgi:hypothetical protein